MSVVSTIALAGEKFGLSIAVNVGERKRMRLRERFVDDVLCPTAIG